MPADLRVLVLGGHGQLGTALASAALPGGPVVLAPGRADADVTSRASLDVALGAARPDLVVNAAAYTAVDRAEAEAERCFAVNRDGAGFAAAACAARRLPLIHVSTDYVFDGASGRPYGEDDVPAPINRYGASKAAGEAAARNETARLAVLRTSWLFGERGPSFVHAILRQAGRGAPLRVVADQLGRPTAAAQLAGVILRLAAGLAERDAGWGTFHAIGGPAVSWHGFAGAVLAAAYGDAAPAVTPVPTSEYPTPAARPRRSVLGGDRLLAEHGIGALNWRAGLPEMVRALRAPLPAAA